MSLRPFIMYDLASHYHFVIVTIEDDEVLGFPDVHPTRELSFVGDLVRAKKQLAASQHVYLGYRRRSGTNETEVVLLSNTITVANAVKLITQNTASTNEGLSLSVPLIGCVRDGPIPPAA